MEVKSHVQMPKGLMKAFSHSTKDGKCVYFLDLKDMEIKEEKINVLGTIKGLYDSTSEAILDQLYESPFFQAAQNIRKFSRGKLPTYTFTPQDEAAFEKFIKMSMMRSTMSRDSAESSSFTASVFPDAFNALIVPVMHVTLPKFELFNGYRFNCLVNRSNLRFVAPRNCLIFCSNNETGFVIFPISPDVAIMYMPEELFKLSLDEDGNLWYAAVEQGEEETIRNINRKAATTEIHFNNDFLIGAEREELQILKNDLSGEQQ